MSDLIATLGSLGLGIGLTGLFVWAIARSGLLRNGERWRSDEGGTGGVSIYPEESGAWDLGGDGATPARATAGEMVAGATSSP